MPYNNGFASCYEELKTFYPGWYRDVLEMDAVWQYGGETLDGLESAVMALVDNNCIQSSDLRTVERLEKYLSITSDPTKDIEDRKRLIMSFFLGFGKLSATKIKQIISIFTPSPCAVYFKDSIIDVRIMRDIGDTFILGDCYYILQKRIPAHLGLVTTIVSPFEQRCYFGSVITQYKQEVV